MLLDKRNVKAKFSMRTSGMKRRDLLAYFGAASISEQWLELLASPSALAKDIPRRTLGKTGLRVSLIGLGGSHMGEIKDEAEALRLVDRAYDLGVNFYDSAFSYANGLSEERYGRAFSPEKRKKVFLMTKSTARDKETAQKEMDESLRRLRSDYIDLWQFHSIRTPEDVQRTFGPGGAMETAARALKEGKIRHLGMTGHANPAAHVEALKYADHLETIQMVLNVIDSADTLPKSGLGPGKSFEKLVLGGAVQKGLGVLAMKTLAGGEIVSKNLAPAPEALRYVLNLPISILISGCAKMADLEANVAITKTFSPMTENEKDALRRIVRPFVQAGVEYYKGPKGSLG
jgi:aryl-alcohol dehydrogenase-like predicted oxidoreductase